jgi:hypothetical protein
MECEFCDCTRNIRLSGKPIVEELHIAKEGNSNEGISFIDIGRLKLNRKKQKKGIKELRNINDNGDKISKNLKPIFAGAAISGLLAIFYDTDGQDNFRIRNIPDTIEARRLLSTLELQVDDTVTSMKMTARNSLAQNDKRSNVV